MQVRGSATQRRFLFLKLDSLAAGYESSVARARINRCLMKINFDFMFSREARGSVS